MLDRCNDGKLAWDRENCPSDIRPLGTFGLTGREFISALIQGQHPIDKPKEHPQNVSILKEIAEKKSQLENPDVFWDSLIENLLEQLCEVSKNKQEHEPPSWTKVYKEIPDPAKIIDAQAILDSWEHNPGPLGREIPPPRITGRRTISEDTFDDTARFVEERLGVFRVKPKLEHDLRETPPGDIGAQVVGIEPERSAIIYARNIIPESREVQRRLMLHELSELRFGELDPKKLKDIHRQAKVFVEQHYRVAGAASQEATEAALKERGYYWAFQPTVLNLCERTTRSARPKKH